jgi:hypothetical protein
MPARRNYGHVNVALRLRPAALGEVLLGRVPGHIHVVMGICLVARTMTVLLLAFATLFGMARARVDVPTIAMAGYLLDLLTAAIST